jgi:ankyrin repeat protein
MRRQVIIGWAAALSCAVMFFLLPALLTAQAAANRPPEKPQVVDMGTFKVSAPSGKGWAVDVDHELSAVFFSKFREGLLSQLTNQQRGMQIRVKADIVNIYGWRFTEEEVADEMLSRFASVDFPPEAKLVREVLELSGRKLYTVRCREYPGGLKMDSIICLHFPPDFAKSHRYFDIDFQFIRGGGMLKLYNNPALEPIEAVAASLEIVDPLHAIPGPHGDLLRAAAAGHAEGVVQALEKGADINAVSPEKGALSVAAYHGRREIVDLLLERGAGIDNPDEKDGMTPLLAAIIGREPEIAKLFVEKGADINRKIKAGGGTGVTPLMFAAALGYLDLVRAILDAGAELEARTELGESALVLAADNGWAEGAAMLLERGADVNARMSNGWTALMRAADKGHSEIVGILLENKADANLKATDGGLTALMAASSFGLVDTVKMLIEKGADVNARIESTGDTALYVAVYKNLPDISKILIEAGADVNLKLDDGQTALMKASEEGQAEIVKLLIEKGADVNAKNNKGQTALKFAKKKKKTEIVRMLQAAGAKG